MFGGDAHCIRGSKFTVVQTMFPSFPLRIRDLDSAGTLGGFGTLKQLIIFIFLEAMCQFFSLISLQSLKGEGCVDKMLL